MLPDIEDESPDECTKIVYDLEIKMSGLNALVNLIMQMMISMTKTLGAVAKLDNFDLQVVQTFLKEILVFLDLMLSTEYRTKLPFSWIFFRNIAADQLHLFGSFGSYIKAENFKKAQDVIWDISNNTHSQKEFLTRCITESVGFEDVMLEVGAALESMLLLQDNFILKLIARLKRSRDAKGGENLTYVEV
jgi:hypothetical protein